MSVFASLTLLKLLPPKKKNHAFLFTKPLTRTQAHPPTRAAYILASLGMCLAASRRLRGREKGAVIARCDLQ